jgi:hypothetical protein
MKGVITAENLHLFAYVNNNACHTPVRAIAIDFFGLGCMLTFDKDTENGKFFGFGVCQKTNIQLIDIDRVINVSTANSFKNYFGVNGEYISPYPKFYVTEVNRDENTNTISVTAYDILYSASKHTITELGLLENATVREMAEAIADYIGASGLVIEGVGAAENCFNIEGGNFDGTENLRYLLNAIAEATQTIYFINHQEQLVFKRLSVSGEPVATITRDEYYILDSKTNRRLTKIVHATELGDNVSAELAISGSTQYIRNNPFWELRDDVATLLDNALAVAGSLTINQFSMNWSGNFLLEIGDRIAITLEDGSLVYSYLLNDVVRFLGYVDEDTQWSYEDNENETPTNPSSLGEVIKQTYARVDKAKKQIDLVAGETATNSSNIAALQINTNSINASVQETQKATTDALENINGEIADIAKKVNMQITPEQMKIEIQNELSNGTAKVETSTGFTFNEEGLTISKNNSEIKTQITEDGMSVYKKTQEVLTANKDGVKAVDLHATTFLIIGSNSRFEDMGKRTACFWIGG